MIELLHCDCMEYMATVPDKYFDLAIVDPPYGQGQSIVNVGECPAYVKSYEWNDEIPADDYFIELFRISKNQIIWGGNYFTNDLPPSECWLIWDKGQREFSLADGEMAWASFDKAMRICTLHRAVANQETKYHPTQKPVKLYRWLLKNYAKEGDKILDTHGGSMSSAIACHQMGFDLTLCELNKDYYEAGVKRFREQTMQQSLFKP